MEKPDNEETIDEQEDPKEEDKSQDDNDSQDEEPQGEDIEPTTREGYTEKPKEEDDTQEEIDPDDEKAISRVVDKKISPLQAKIQKQNDEIEVNSYIVDNPEMAKYKPAILKYLSHPAYKNIPVKNIAAIVSADDMQKIGADKERQARERADKTKEQGNTSRQKTDEVDWKTASFKDVEAEIARVKSRI